MYKNQLDGIIKSKKLNFKAYLLYGVNEFLIQEYARDISTTLANGDDIKKVYFQEYDFKSCEEYLLQSSLFASSNVLLIKTSNKIPKKELDMLVKASNSNPNSYLIIGCTGSVDFKSMTKSFGAKTNSCEVRFFNPTEQEAIQILLKNSNKQNIKCDINSLQYLYHMHQKDLSLVVNDLNKLSILDEAITVNIINKQCFGMGAVDLEIFLYKLFLGQPINKELYLLLEEGIGEINLIGQTMLFAQQLFNISCYLQLYGQLNILDIWGYKLPNNIANKRASISKKFNIIQYKYILNFFQDLELELKTNSKLDANGYTQAKYRLFSKYILTL